MVWARFPDALRALSARMQHIDRPTQVEPLPKPARASSPRVHVEPPRGVIRPERLDRIVRHPRGRRHLRQLPAVRTREPQFAVRPSGDLIALLVHRAMVATAQQAEIGKRRGAALSPVAQVVPLAHPHTASREAAAPVPLLERAPEGGRNGPGPRPDLHDAPSVVVPHHHPARIAGQTPRRFRGNVRAVLEDGLPRLIRIGQRRCIDMDHHLAAQICLNSDLNIKGGPLIRVCRCQASWANASA